MISSLISFQSSMLIGIEFLVCGDFLHLSEGNIIRSDSAFFVCVCVCARARACVCVCVCACPPTVKRPMEEQWLAELQVGGNANFGDGSKGPNMSVWLKKGVVSTPTYVYFG